jgi:hypothetical protein
MLSGMAGRDPGPENLPGILLQAFWRSLADDPVATLLLMASASLGGVVLVLLGLVVGGLLGVLVALL